HGYAVVPRRAGRHGGHAKAHGAPRIWPTPSVVKEKREEMGEPNGVQPRETPVVLCRILIIPGDAHRRKSIQAQAAGGPKRDEVDLGIAGRGAERSGTTGQIPGSFEK